MQFLLKKDHNSTLVEQARQQLLAALHTGKLSAGDRLPSVRQIAQRNRINRKTAFSIYQHLQDEGYVTLRTGAGAFVATIEQVDLDQAYCLSLLNLIRTSLTEAERLKLDSHKYFQLVGSFIDRTGLDSVRLGVIECNEEQTDVFAREISDRLNVRVFPLLLKQLESPDCSTTELLKQIDLFATTDFHFNRVKTLISKYQKKLLRLRLNPIFIPSIVEAAEKGRVLMIVSNTSYFPAFCRSLRDIGTPPTVIERITAINHRNRAQLRSAISQAQAVYISSICDLSVRRLIPGHIKELKFDSILSQESIEIIQAVVLLYGGQQMPSP
jgi:DNA-binding transcriptional regulator YhcF (GntR family)